MGEMAVCAGGKLRTLLGSCVGVALYDHKQGLGGLAHIVLPDSRGVSEMPGKYVDTAIPMLIDQLTKLSGGELRLRAKIAGGANMFSTKAVETIGDQNQSAIESLLQECGISVIARHCGGTQGRRMTLDTTSGEVFIEIVGAETVRL